MSYENAVCRNAATLSSGVQNTHLSSHYPILYSVLESDSVVGRLLSAHYFLTRAWKTRLLREWNPPLKP
jgi:hypothetical protein